MNLNDGQRALLANRLRHVERVRFHGSKLAAYTAAGINSATWARLTKGESVKPQTVTKVCLALWPESQGDVARVLDDFIDVAAADVNPEAGRGSSELPLAELIERLAVIERRLDALERGSTSRPALAVADGGADEGEAAAAAAQAAESAAAQRREIAEMKERQKRGE